LLLALSLTACAEDPAGDDDATGDDDTTADDDDDDDDDSAGERFGLLGRVGAATVTEDSYVGSEDLYFAADYGEGEDICRIRYPLVSVAVREDCEDCVWAFDLVLGAPELLSETHPGCLSTVGVDGAALDDLEGTAVSYGYNPDYFGHIQVLRVEQVGSWDSAGHASWDEGSGAFDYDWQDGYHTY